MDTENLPNTEQSLEATPKAKRKSKFRQVKRTFFVVIALGLIVAAYYKYFFVFGDGVKSGHLNYAVKKGNIFKTYEGKLIQEGYRSKAAGTIQS